MSVAALRKLRLVSAAAVVILAIPLFASRPYVVEDGIAQRLERGAAPGERLVLDHVPVIDGNPMSLELQRFEVWAPDAKITIHDSNGVHEEDPPHRIFYRGSVTGSEDSLAFFSVDPTDSRNLEGIILIGERKFSLGRGVRTPLRAARPGAGDDDPRPLLVRELDPYEDVLDPGGSWTCAVDGKRIARRRLDLPKEALALRAQPTAGNVAGAKYALRIAVETDFELYTGLGSTSGAVTTYITSLVGAASTIYQRDLNTTLNLGNLAIYATAADPYNVTPSGNTAQALSELSTVWHANHCTPVIACNTTETARRSAVVMVSGKIFNAGIAWIDQIGAPSAAADFPCGANGSNCGSTDFSNGYSGAYAFCGSLSPVTTTVPDPNATVNGTQYALPANNNFWILMEFAHELGHVVGAEHTQCTPLTAGEKTLYSTTRNFVDECYNADSPPPGGSCFSGSTNFVGPCFTSGAGVPLYCAAPPELGTIMSYCQNVFCPAGSLCGGVNTGSFRSSRYLFGKTGEPSFKMLGIANAALEAATPNGTITIGSAPVACSAGQTASVASCTNCTYSWQLTGGSITSGTTGSSITYTPTASSLTATVTITTIDGNGITTSATRATSCVAITAPTNVVATAASATSVSITWTAVGGATSYTVYRSANNSTYSSVGTPATNFLTDTTAAANTSYFYKVTATNGGGTSGDSNKDLATTVVFTDPTLTVHTTPIKAAHITQLRTAVDAMRALANAGAANPATYTNPTLTAFSSLIKAVDLTELRTNLNNVRTSLGLSTITFTDSTITTHTTLVKAVHINELRAGTQ
jgi:hypothetical protein